MQQSVSVVPSTMREVRIRISMKRIINVDLIEQSFTCELFMEASWVDKKMKGPKKIDNSKNNDQMKGLLYFEGEHDPVQHFMMISELSVKKKSGLLFSTINLMIRIYQLFVVFGQI